MRAVVGRVWGWLRPAAGQEDQQKAGWFPWLLGGRTKQTVIKEEEFWEAPEKIQPLEVECVRADIEQTKGSRWWSKYSPMAYLQWPSRSKPEQKTGDGELSDYGTPPPSPVSSPFRMFVDSWKVDVLPEHQDICFNLLRHLFDLLVVGFLWSVSPPCRLLLELLGVQGALRLWLQGMAMFLVSTVGMAGLLWLLQEHLAQAALLYGVAQALVLSVSLRHSVLLGEEPKGEEPERLTDCGEHPEQLVSDKVKTS